MQVDAGLMQVEELEGAASSRAVSAGWSQRRAPRTRRRVESCESCVVLGGGGRGVCGAAGAWGAQRCGDGGGSGVGGCADRGSSEGRRRCWLLARATMVGAGGSSTREDEERERRGGKSMTAPLRCLRWIT
eukprot:SAG11_NODE_4434_length_1895_cov_46.741091_1_plen_131_part_00